MKKKILCIEDDPTIQTLVEVALPEFEVIAATNLKDAKKFMTEVNFKALIVDIQLPDGDGLRYLTEISKQEDKKKIPVLILSSHKEISNKVMAFSFGAEDFIEKPFDPIELNARVSAKVKKYDTETDDLQSRKIGNLLLDFSRQKAFLTSSGSEKDLGLTSIELKILSMITKRMEQVYSRAQIMDQVWGETFITDRTIDSHIAHLRQKITPTTLEIETAKNFGYRALIKK